MPKPCLTLCLLAAGLLTGGQARAQLVFYDTSSATVSQNALASTTTNGASTTLFTATGIDFNGVNRCTAVAVDGVNGKLFMLDGAGNSLWSVNLDGSGLARVKGNLTNTPTDLALDVLNQKIYYTTSSATLSGNTVQRVDYTGANNTVLYLASSAPPDDAATRCTALALDTLNSRLFIADAGTGKIWSMNSSGGDLVPLVISPGQTPLDLAVDPANQQVYFTVSSTVQVSNLIERVNYNGSGLRNIFTASGGVQRCTALDVDPAHSVIYLSDAVANTLWRIPIGGGSPTSMLGGLSATARRVRWFSEVSAPPPPAILSLNISGTRLIFSGSNGVIGGTYYILTSTNAAAPLSQWLPVSTNVLGANGNFMISTTNGFIPGTPRQFYVIRVQ